MATNPGKGTIESQLRVGLVISEFNSEQDTYFPSEPHSSTVARIPMSFAYFVKPGSTTKILRRFRERRNPYLSVLQLVGVAVMASPTASIRYPLRIFPSSYMIVLSKTEDRNLLLPALAALLDDMDVYYWLPRSSDIGPKPVSPVKMFRFLSNLVTRLKTRYSPYPTYGEWVEVPSLGVMGRVKKVVGREVIVEVNMFGSPVDLRTDLRLVRRTGEL